VSLEDRVRELAAEVAPVDEAAAAAALERHGRLVKPPGSLGRVEALGVQLAGIAATSPPPVPQRPAAVVAAGDHGVVAEGVSRWPSEVTGLMVGQFCLGRAAVSAVAKTVGAQVSVLDVGVASELPRHPRLRGAKVAAGTANLATEPAMTGEQAARAILAGAGIAEELIGAGVDLLVTGDMGIGNTTPAACLIAALTGSAPEHVTGPGAGGDAAAVAAKAALVGRALARHSGVAVDPVPVRSPLPVSEPAGPHTPSPEPVGAVASGHRRANGAGLISSHGLDPLALLAGVGGFEHAALVGLILRGAAERVPVVLDGVSTLAAALVATALCPPAAGYLIAGHRSTEPGAGVALQHLGLQPILDLDMRLGEATGGLLAVPVVAAAARVLGDMATFEEAGIST
jgi:nicotinate-nucleotide--dimethylbenzimidazole phosphoribosyltransferase